MKIGVDIGHNIPTIDTGATGFLLEGACNLEIGTKLITHLKNFGYEVINCLPKQAVSKNDSLNKRCQIANSNNVDFFVSIHCNASREHDAEGCEVWNYSQATDDVSTRICANISKAIGVKNRGNKYTTSFAVLNSTNCKAILVECLFIDNIVDTNKYNADKISKAIAEGIANRKIENSLIRLQVGAFFSEKNADQEILRLKKLGVDAVKVYS